MRGGIDILLGDGRGLFTPQPPILVPGVDFYKVVLGDLNGDSVRDLVGLYSGGLYVWFGMGDGTFLPPAIYSTALPTDAQIADLNGDGSKDLVFADSQSEVVVLLNRGKGVFEDPIVTTLPETVNQIIVGDFNKDGKKDLAVMSNLQVYVLLGNGDGTFRRPVFTFHSLVEPQAIVAGDFNGDGNLDVAISDRSRVGIFPGNGDGIFGSASFVATLESSGPPSSSGIETVNLSGGRRLNLVTLSLNSLTSLINITHD